MNTTNWMAWESGVDLVALSSPTLQAPNIIVHVARMVHTPVGSAPSGMILWQPDPNAAPLAIGFVSTCPKVGAYFGPKIFAGTPFGEVPVLDASITITNEENSASACVKAAGLEIQVTLSGLGQSYLINREPSAMPPFHQQGLEQVATSASLKINGQEIPLTIPPTGISGGPAAVFSPCGIYAR